MHCTGYLGNGHLNLSYPSPIFGLGWGTYSEVLPVSWLQPLNGTLMSDSKLDLFESLPKMRDARETILVWTDGACWPNPGRGGWGWHRADGASDFGGERETTNNRMELTAIFEALRALPDGAAAIIYSDSQYCVRGLNDWSTAWSRKMWMRKGAPMPNRDLWIALEDQKRRVNAEFVWVRGHAGNIGNEIADRLAEQGRTSA